MLVGFPPLFLILVRSALPLIELAPGGRDTHPAVDILDMETFVGKRTSKLFFVLERVSGERHHAIRSRDAEQLLARAEPATDLVNADSDVFDVDSILGCDRFHVVRRHQDLLTVSGNAVTFARQGKAATATKLVEQVPEVLDGLLQPAAERPQLTETGQQPAQPAADLRRPRRA